MSASGLAAHLSPAELGQRYRTARCPVERSHLQIVWLLGLGRSEREGAQVTGYGRRWVGEVARRYDEDGPGGLGDRRRGNVGAKPLLGAEGEAALRAALSTPPADGRLWTLQLPTSSTSRRGGYSYGFDLRLDPIRLDHVRALERLSPEECDSEDSQQTIDQTGKNVGNC